MYGLIQIAALPLALLVVGSPQASDGEAGAIPPSAAAGSGIPPSTGELPAVLRGYTEELEYAAGIGRGCVVLEGADIIFAVRTLDVAAPFEQYRDRVRAAVDLVAKDIARLDEADPRAKDGDGRREAIARIKTKHRAQVYAAIDAAQAELMLALDADATTRQRMIRHALWREVRDGTDTNGYDAGMLLEDDSEPTSMKLRAAIAADPKAAGRMRELLAAHDLRAGPARESGMAVHRAMYAPDAVRNAASMERLAKSLSGVRSANETLLDGIAATARECGASAELFEWRARAFKLRAPQLLPATDLLDTFDLARTAGDAMDADAMRAARFNALEQRDQAVSRLHSAFTKCRESLGVAGPDSHAAERVLQQFAQAAQAWESCERAIGAALKSQLQDPACPAGAAIDRYLTRQDSLAQDHWRGQVQFWTSFVEDQRTK